MTVTVNLPQKVEQASVAAARCKGISVDALVADVLASNSPVPETLQHHELVEEHGIPVQCTGHTFQLPRQGASV